MVEAYDCVLLLLLKLLYDAKMTFANTGFLVVRKSARYYAGFDEMWRGIAPVDKMLIFCSPLKTTPYNKSYIYFFFFYNRIDLERFESFTR